jgi:hypothetical protein
MNHPESHDAPRRSLHVETRLAIYLAVWILAVLAFELFLRVEGRTENFLSPAEQRLRWPLFTPVMVIFGVMHSVSSRGEMSQAFFWLVGALFLAHAILTLRCTRPNVFAVLIGLQAVTVAFGVAHFIHFSWQLHEP